MRAAAASSSCCASPGPRSSEPAIAYADELDIGLFTFSPAAVVSPVNARARAVAALALSAQPRYAGASADASTFSRVGMEESLSVARYVVGVVLAVGTGVFLSQWIHTGKINNAALSVLVVMAVGASVLVLPVFIGLYRATAGSSGAGGAAELSDGRSCRCCR